MRQRYSEAVKVVLVSGALLGVAACQPAMEDEDVMNSDVPRLEGTTHPDIHGVWQAFSEVGYNLEGQAAQAALVLHEGVPNGSPVPNAPVLALGALGGAPPSLGAVVGETIPYRPEAPRNETTTAHTPSHVIRLLSV